MLEIEHKTVVEALHILYRRNVNGERVSGEELGYAGGGQPSTHAILESLGLMNPDDSCSELRLSSASTWDKATEVSAASETSSIHENHDAERQFLSSWSASPIDLDNVQFSLTPTRSYSQPSDSQPSVVQQAAQVPPDVMASGLAYPGEPTWKGSQFLAPQHHSLLSNGNASRVNDFPFDFWDDPFMDLAAAQPSTGLKTNLPVDTPFPDYATRPSSLQPPSIIVNDEKRKSLWSSLG